MSQFFYLKSSYCYTEITSAHHIHVKHAKDKQLEAFLNMSTLPMGNHCSVIHWTEENLSFLLVGIFLCLVGNKTHSRFMKIHAICVHSVWHSHLSNYFSKFMHIDSAHQQWDQPVTARANRFFRTIFLDFSCWSILIPNTSRYQIICSMGTTTVAQSEETCNNSEISLYDLAQCVPFVTILFVCHSVS